MSRAIDSFLANLVGVKDWNPQFAQIKAWAKTGKVSKLLATAEALTDDGRSASLTSPVRRGILDFLERTLALTPSFAQAEAALAVLQMREAQKTREAMRGPAARQPSRRQHEAELASLLAQGHPPRHSRRPI